ncbi:TolC family protein [Sphingomonas agri]|uniref:TolC family protein n=1 Tax=Sphingomonas agri TaxID=1813878 RepID=UPI00312051D4
MRTISLVGIAAVALATTAIAEDRPTAPPILTLQDALALASGDQPMVTAYTRDAQASEEAAAAARSLPDPQLSVGVQDFPVTGGTAFSPTRDDFTMYMIGIMREQVRRSKREAAAAQLKAEAVVSREQATAQQVHVRRDVTVAWLNAVEASAKERLLLRVIGDLKTGQKIMEAGVPTGASSPALALEAQAEVALAQSQLADAKGAEAHARGELARWIGGAAQRPLPDALPNLTLPASMQGQMLDHPHLRVALAEQAAAQRQVDVARTDRRPDFTWSVNYGFRPSFGDFVSAQVSIPLQINRKGLQNRKIAEAQDRADAAMLRAEDVRRELEGQYQTALADYRGADAQLDSLTKTAIPSLEAAFKAAEARYQGGQGSLDLPLNIVRRYVETNITLVEQEGKRARAAAEIIYLMGEAAR